MDIKILKTFIAVAEYKNFSVAAKMRNTVQPTISRHISELERELNVQLFARSTHHVELTSWGEKLLPEAINIIANDERVKLLMKSDKPEKSIINIGYLATACSFFVPHLIGQLKKEDQQVDTYLSEMTNNQQCSALQNNEIDFAFSRYQADLLMPEFNMMPVYTDKLVAVLPEEHPLAKNCSVKLCDLRNEAFILFQREEWFDVHEHILKSCMKQGFIPKVTHKPENMRHLVISVSSGLGVSIAPQCIKFIAQSGCVCLPIDDFEFQLPLYLYYKAKNLNQINQAFIKCCVSETDYIKKVLSARGLNQFTI